MKKVLLAVFCFSAFVLTANSQILYGTTYGGGAKKHGTISKFITSTNSLTVAQSFESFPASPVNTNLIQATDGKFYGMTREGGSLFGPTSTSNGNFGFGVIFSYDPSTSTFRKLKNFDGANGGNPEGSLVQASNGKLYGMTRYGGSSDVGVIFSFDPVTSVYKKLKDFNYINGAQPTGSLIQAMDGKLYGMTWAGGIGYGVIFSFDPTSSTLVKLNDFDNVNGSYPNGDLIEATDGKFYGMTSKGGSTNVGVIFSLDRSSSNYVKLKDFDYRIGGGPSGSLLQANDGKLYGLAGGFGSHNRGVIFSFDPVSASYTHIDFNGLNGSAPLGNLIQANDGRLYGMTGAGGIYNHGNIFSFDPSTSNITNLQDFDNKSGDNPGGSLMQAKDGKLYGLTSSGGALNSNSGAGVIFSYDIAATTYTKLKYIGNNNTGSVPSELIKAIDGKFYGVTADGGSNGNGVIYSFDPGSAGFNRLFDFDGTNGSNPNSAMTLASNGIAYGTTFYGGANDYGVIFSYDPSSNSYKKLFDFNGSNGKHPAGTLVQTNGKLYGLAYDDINFHTLIFSLDITSLTYVVEYEFINILGTQAMGSLIKAKDGKIYGAFSGAFDNGIIFSYDPNSSVYSTLYDFDSTNGAGPISKLTQANDGKLYGMTQNGGLGGGVIFSFDPVAAVYSKLHSFIFTVESGSSNGLFQASDGKLYGTANGGINRFGFMFSYDPLSATYTKLIEYNGIDGAYPNSAFIELKSCNVETTYYQDADSDGYGNSNITLQACTQPTGYVSDSTDCDDNNAAVHPGATEICGNGIDDNCNGQVDENCNTTPTISINDVSVTEAKGFAKLTVSLSQVTDKPVGILYYTKDGTATSRGNHKDYNTKIGLLFIPAGSLNATISIKIIKDNIDEPSEYFDVILFRALHAGIADGTGRVTITDDGRWITHSTMGSSDNESESANQLFAIKVLPNPSANTFQLSIEGNNRTTKAGMKVMDLQGRLIETRSNLRPGEVIKFGSKYRPGSYFVHIEQGEQKQTIKIIKLPE